MTEKRYIANIKQLQTLIQGEFGFARELLLNQKNEKSSAPDALLAELQSQDIISQRIQHLIEGFENSKPFFGDKKFKHAFLDLQYFQLISIERDLEKTIAAIKALGVPQSWDSNASAPCNTQLFQRHNEIRQLLNGSNRIAMRCTAQRILCGPSPLNNVQAADCLKLYTMQSERIVLQWFLSNMPFGKRSDLLEVYEEKMKNVNTDSVELF